MSSPVPFGLTLAFIVSFEVTINVYAPDQIGQLVDDFLKLQDHVTIKGFEWQPLDVYT